MMIKIFTLVSVLALSACTNESDAVSALEAYGFTDIQMDGYKLFGCGQDDMFHTGFIAKNPNGKTVSGVVCSGILKSATVRF